MKHVVQMDQKKELLFGLWVCVWISLQVIWMGNMADMASMECQRVPNATCVSANWMTSRHLKTTMSVRLRGILSGHNFQNFDIFMAPGNFSDSSPLRAAAPEAIHRCIWQQGMATSGLSNGFSRPRRSWMRRATNLAVASDEDSGDFGGNLLRDVIVVRKWRKCW